MISESVRTALRLRNRVRQECRTDLIKLCEVLGYPDVNRKVHGPIVDVLQQFPGGEDVEVKEGVFEYKPSLALPRLEGPHERLILYPRGHLKTTVITQAHLIQWILNYPDIRILLSCYTGDQVDNVIRKVKGVFQFNPQFRALFPEFCPARDKASDFGSKDQFTTPARKLVRGEPTVFSVTVGKTIAGYHPDVIFHSDLVDKENVKTPGGIKDVISHFQYMNPLLERYSETPEYPATRGWIFVEGTPYDFGDLHTLLADDNKMGAGWAKVVQPAETDKGEILWPERFPRTELDKIKKELGDWLFSAQYLMKCIPEGDGLCDPKDVAFIPGEVIRSLLPSLRLHATVDLAGMETGNKGDFTAISLGGFDRDGRLYVIEIHCGRFAPEEVISMIFDIYKRYPQIIDFKVEKDAHARVLLPFLQREMSKRNRYPLVYPIPRDTRSSKQHRIRGLRPWFRQGIIRFSGDIPIHTRRELLEEIGQFPSESSGVHDDILDTLADQMQNSEGDLNIDVIADAPDQKFSQFGQPRPPDRFLGFDERGIAQWLYGPDADPENNQRFPTGIM